MFTLADNTPEMYSELEFSLRHQAMPMAMQQAIQSEMYSLREEEEVGQNGFPAPGWSRAGSVTGRWRRGGSGDREGGRFSTAGNYENYEGNNDDVRWSGAGNYNSEYGMG